MASSTILLLLALLNVCVVVATNPCYFPNGNLAPRYVPCSPNGDGDCCAEEDFCTSLGYCISNAKGYHYRGACTDVTWFNPSCPDYCLADSNCLSSPIAYYMLRSYFNIETDIYVFTQPETVAPSTCSLAMQQIPAEHGAVPTMATAAHRRPSSPPSEQFLQNREQALPALLAQQRLLSRH